MDRHDSSTITSSPAPMALSSAITKASQPDALSYSNLHHYASIADPPAPRVINSTGIIYEKPKPDGEQRDILNLDFVKQTSSVSKSILSNKPTQHTEPLSKPPITHSFDHAFDTSIAFNKSYDISSTKAIEMFNRAATMSFSKTKSFPTALGSDPMNFSKSFTSPSHTIKHDTATELSSLTNRSSSGLLSAYQPPSTLHSSYSLYSLDSKSTHLAYNAHELDVQAQQTQQKHSMYGGERLEQSTLISDNRLKTPTELNIPAITSHRYDVSGYDPNIRSTIIHPLTDDNLNSNNCYYPPKEHVASSLYAPNKNVLPLPPQTTPASSLPASNPYGMVSRYVLSNIAMHLYLFVNT